MSEKTKKEYAMLRVPVEVVEICKNYSQLMEMQTSTRVTIVDAFETIYKPVIDVSKIQNASKKLEEIRQASIKDSKGILKDLEL